LQGDELFRRNLVALKDFYSNQLLTDTVSFWFPRSFDKEHGGFLLMRDADGGLIFCRKCESLFNSY